MEVGKVLAKLVVALVVIPLHSGVLDGPVHAFDLAVGPRMVWLGQAMLDAIGLTDHVEPHRPGINFVPVPRGFVAEIRLSTGFPLPRTDLAYGYGPGHAES